MMVHSNPCRENYKVSSNTIVAAYKKRFPKLSVNAYARERESTFELEKRLENLEEELHLYINGSVKMEACFYDAQSFAKFTQMKNLQNSCGNEKEVA